MTHFHEVVEAAVSGWTQAAIQAWEQSLGCSPLSHSGIVKPFPVIDKSPGLELLFIFLSILKDIVGCVQIFCLLNAKIRNEKLDLAVYGCSCRHLGCYGQRMTWTQEFQANLGNSKSPSWRRMEGVRGIPT